MKTSKFSGSQIIAILKQGESGVPVSTLCREHGMSSASYYKWRKAQFKCDKSVFAEAANSLALVKPAIAMQQRTGMRVEW